MLNWYLRQGWPKQLVVLAIVIVSVPLLWTALASFLFVDLMTMRPSHPYSDVDSYFVWWDYFLVDGQPWRVQRWLLVSAAVAALPFIAAITRQFTDWTKKPTLHGTTGFANRQEMLRGGIKTRRRPF